MELEIMTSKISQFKMSNITSFHLFVESRPKMMMILMGHECERRTVCGISGRCRRKGGILRGEKD
jgi:hypothetical protein